MVILWPLAYLDINFGTYGLLIQHAVIPLHFQVLHLQIQPGEDWKYLNKSCICIEYELT